ncbi:hypothetical protein QBC38DRAFT_184042 [Podospora fimiseda]|uniref:CBM1 domain-containing protein n=1 Tax=Podospora fimiseda TaxID=252190 RepID=A0AAN7BQX1_9PEZI|nr:hypothetical protein QBC38DRAFT_184042 [Podospora fimiseda]
MRVSSALPVFVAGATAQVVKGPYEQCGGQGVPDAACQNGWQCTTYNPYYAQCIPGPTSAPAPGTNSIPSIITTTRSTLVTITTAPTITSPPTTTQAPGSNPTPTTLQSGWYWIRAVASPNYRSYLQPQPTASPQSAIIASYRNAGQFNVVSGQLIQNKFGNGANTYLHIENPTDKTQRKLKTWFETTPNTYGTFGFQGDTLVWSVEDIKRPNTAAWLVCGEGKELFVNTGAFLYDTPAGCFDHTIHSYGGSQADV